MTTATFPAMLRELAGLSGVLTAYVGVDGRTRQVEPDVVRAILGSLGVDATDERRTASSVEEVRASRSIRPIPPVLVDRAAGCSRPPVVLPSSVAPEDVWIIFEPEGGLPCRRRLGEVARATSSPVEPDGRHLHRFEVELDRLAPDLAPGYHRLHVEMPGTSATALLVSAPACPPAVRGWGVFLPLHAVRTDDDWGTGSYTDLVELVRWTRRLGGSMVGTLPLYPILDPSVDPSPYRPASRLAYNELYVDPTALPELALARDAGMLDSAADLDRHIAAAHRASLVDYAGVAQARRSVLEPMADALAQSRSPRNQALGLFAAAHPEIVAYAQFRAARESGRRWCRDSPEPQTDQQLRSMRYHLFSQWVAAAQLQAAQLEARSLYADLPLGVHPEGFDPCWCPDTFVPGASGGAPPDRFNPKGQNWSFPPMHPETIRSDGYRYFIASLRRVLAHASFLRIDHVMGLHRLYWVPAGADARHGTYVTYHHDELRAIVALEAYRADAVVIGEDLGTVPEGVRQHMAEDGMLRSWVLQFEASEDDPLPKPARDVLASCGTHDLPRFTAFFLGRDIAKRVADGIVPPGQAAEEQARRRRWARAVCRLAGADPDEGELDARHAQQAYVFCVSHLAASDATLMLIDLEETWGEQESQNHPGTSTGEPNWQRRARYTLAEAARCPDIRELGERIDQLRGDPARDLS